MHPIIENIISRNFQQFIPLSWCQAFWTIKLNVTCYNPVRFQLRFFSLIFTSVVFLIVVQTRWFCNAYSGVRAWLSRGILAAPTDFSLSLVLNPLLSGLLLTNYCSFPALDFIRVFEGIWGSLFYRFLLFLYIGNDNRNVFTFKQRDKKYWFYYCSPSIKRIYFPLTNFINMQVYKLHVWNELYSHSCHTHFFFFFSTSACLKFNK